MTTEDDFQRQLDLHPDDWQTRLVFADWLQERDDPRAEGYRALGVLRRHPHNAEGEIRYYDADAYDCSFDEDNVDVCPESNLPHDWYRLIDWERIFPPEDLSSHHVAIWETRRAADDAVALAFAKLPAERRAELLNPQPLGAAA